MRNFILYPRVNTLQVLLRTNREVAVLPVFSESDKESAVQQRLGQREVVKVGREHAEVVERHGALDTVQTVGLIFERIKGSTVSKSIIKKKYHFEVWSTKNLLYT